MNSSPNAPWKGGRERSERWRETRSKGFPPRVSDRTRRAFLSANLGLNTDFDLFRFFRFKRFVDRLKNGRASQAVPGVDIGFAVMFDGV